MSDQDSTLTKEERLLVIPKSAALSTADRKALKDAGIVVISVENPSDVRLLTGDPFPLKSSHLLRAALHGLNSANVSDSVRSRAWTCLVQLATTEIPK